MIFSVESRLSMTRLGGRRIHREYCFPAVSAVGGRRRPGIDAACTCRPPARPEGAGGERSVHCDAPIRGSLEPARDYRRSQASVDEPQHDRLLAGEWPMRQIGRTPRRSYTGSVRQSIVETSSRCRFIRSRTQRTGVDSRLSSALAGTTRQRRYSRRYSTYLWS